MRLKSIRCSFFVGSFSLPVRVDAQELIQLLDLTPPEQNVMLVGRHGIGKSEIVAEHFAGKSMRVVAFFLGQMSDPGDLIGLLHKDEANARSEFLPPFWWPEDNQPIVLFLDELNRARPEILQSVMELALNKTLAGKKLPKGSVIISAVNEGDEYQLTDLDPALVSRFNLYEFAPSVDDWLLWAQRHNLDDRVIEFIQKQPQFLDGHGVASNNGPGVQPSDEVLSGLVKTPDRRSWARVSELIKGIDSIDTLHIKLVAGIVGSSAATAFRKSLAIRLSVTASQVLLEFSNQKKKLNAMSLGELIMLNEHLLIWISGGKCADGDREKACEGLLSYTKLLRKRKLDEAVAHLVSLLDKPKHEASMELVSESIELTQMLTQYMEGIQVK